MNNKLTFYVSVWNKYLPVIRILLKKSAMQEQTLGMNRTDFERAVGIRKSGYRFTVNFIDGKSDTLFSGNELVQSFLSVLLNDEIIRDNLRKNDYTFMFNSKYQLQIKNNGSSKQTETAVHTEEGILTD